MRAQLARDKKKRDADANRVFTKLWADPEYVRLMEHLHKVIHRSVELDSVPSKTREMYPAIYPESERELAKAAVKRAGRKAQDYEDAAFKKEGLK